MQRLVNNQKFIIDDGLTKIETNMREVFYEGIKQKAIETCWFARNYNYLYMLRFGVFAILLVNSQYLQIFQIFFSFIIVFSFSAACCYYQYFIEIYETKNTTIIRITQECSISLMIIMTNVFCLDSFLLFLNIQFKHFMVVLFAILMILNVLLEFVLILASIFSLIKSCFKNKKRKTVPEFKKPAARGRLGNLDNKIKSIRNEDLNEGEEEKEEDHESPESIEFLCLDKQIENNKGERTGGEDSIDIRKKNHTKPLLFADVGLRRVQRNANKKRNGKNRLIK